MTYIVEINNKYSLIEISIDLVCLMYVMMVFKAKIKEFGIQHTNW